MRGLAGTRSSTSSEAWKILVVGRAGDACPARRGPARGYRGGMANEHGPVHPRARLSAGTAFKAGFFGAFGVVVFWLLLGLVVGVVALVLAAVGVLPGVAQLFQSVTGP